jgi:hypothetical protein
MHEHQLLLLLWHAIWALPLIGFFGIGQGPTDKEKQVWGTLNSLSVFDITKGEGATTDAMKFWTDIMSGDPSKVGAVLGPEISGIQQRGQQQKQTAAQFGTRSGGTAAVQASADDTTRAGIDSLVANLTGAAATNLGNLGTTLTGQGASAASSAFGAAKTMQEQSAAMWNDIFKSSAQVATGVMGGIGNLDTTGGSSTWEQAKNFMGGF